MIATVFKILAVSLTSGGWRSKSWQRKRWGELRRAPRALVAHIASI